LSVIGKNIFNQKPLLSLTLAFLLFGANGCFLSNINEKQEGAIEIVPVSGNEGEGLLSANAEACGPRGFAKSVHPSLFQNCASCHAGGGRGPGNFASPNALSAYGSAASKTNFALPSGSLLVTKSSSSNHGGGGCINCGPAWAATLTGMIAEWAKAESNDALVCGSLPSVGGGGSGGNSTDPFDDGIYSPGGEAANVEIVTEGLAEFSKTAGVQDFLVNNCSSCHGDAGRAKFAPFAVSASNQSYIEAKLRADFLVVDRSRLMTRISDSEHGDGGCAACGNESLITNLSSLMTAWSAAEFTGVQASRVSLNSKAVGLAGVGPVQLSWDLGAVDSSLSGARFEISVEQSDASEFTYRFYNPTLITAGQSLRVKAIYFVVNGALDPFSATYTRVDELIESNTSLGHVLSVDSALVSIDDRSTDTIGFSFSILRVEE